MAEQLVIPTPLGVTTRLAWTGRLLAFVGTACVVVLILIQVTVVKEPPNLLLTVAQRSESTYAVVSVSPGGIGWTEGLRPGDIVADVLGGVTYSTVDGEVTRNPTQARVVSSEKHVDGVVSVSTQVLPFGQGKPVLWAVAILFAASGMLSFALRAWDRASWALYALLTPMAALLAVAPSSGLRGGVVFQVVTALALLATSCGALWLVVEFPIRQVVSRAFDRLALRIAVTTAPLLFVLYVIAVQWRSGLFDVARLLIMMHLAAGVLLTIWRLLWSYRHTEAKIRQTQILVMALAFAAGVLPPIFLVAIPVSMGVEQELLPMEVATAMLALLPLILLFALVRYQWPSLSKLPQTPMLVLAQVYGAFVAGGLGALLLDRFSGGNVQVGQSGVILLGVLFAAVVALSLGVWWLVGLLVGGAGREEASEAPNGRTTKLEERVRDTERDQLAVDLHDGPLQTLQRAFLLVGLQKGSDPRVMEALEQTATELRSVVQFRRLPRLAGSFVGAMEGLVRSTETLAHIAIVLNINNTKAADELPEDRKVALYRVLQEALSNASKHSKATEIVVQLDVRKQSVGLVIRDNGVGFDPGSLEKKAGHFGLGTMRTRAEAMNGNLVIESAPGKGTAVKVSVPAR